MKFFHVDPVYPHLTLTLGGSKDLMQLAQWPDFKAFTAEANPADFGRLASKASELADLLRVLRGSVLTKRPALPKAGMGVDVG